MKEQKNYLENYIDLSILIEAPVHNTNLESAGLIKYAANALLATKISLINEISMLCEQVGADVHAVAKGMGLDGRIGRMFIHAGPGYGGSCFPKDILALVRIAQEYGVSSRIVESVVEVNAAQKARMVSKIRTALAGNKAGKVIGIIGLHLNQKLVICGMHPFYLFCPFSWIREQKLRGMIL